MKVNRGEGGKGEREGREREKPKSLLPATC